MIAPRRQAGTVVAALALLSLAVSPAALAGPTVTLVLAATSDIHGHLDPSTVELSLEGGGRVKVQRGGMALLGGYLQALRARHPGRVLLLDGGDMLQGTLVSNLGEGEAVVKAMNVLGYGAAAVGNHEFDFGPCGPHVVAGAGEDPRGNLKARAAQARFPWLTANVVDAKGDPVGAPRVKPFTLITVDGIVVGVVGGTSEDTPRTTIASNLAGLTVKPLAPSVVAGANLARAAGATVVVALVHAGGECHHFTEPRDLSSCKPDAEAFRLARALAAVPGGSPVDVILAGHTHQGVAAVVAGIPIAQAFSDARAFARVDLTIDRATGRVVPGGFTIHSPVELCAAVTDGVPSCNPARARGARVVPAFYEGVEIHPLAEVTAAYAADTQRAAARLAAPVGIHLDGPIHRDFRSEAPLCNLVADVLRETGADIGLTNSGGVRADLPAGDLSYGALFEALPFDNRLTRVRVDGAKLRRLITRNLLGDHGLLCFSGLRVVSRCQGDQLAVALTLADGRPVEDGRLYTVATSDFLALGGDDFGMLGLRTADVTFDDVNPTLRDLVARSLRQRKRLRAVEPSLFDPAHRRVITPAPRPFSCPLK